MDVLLVPEIKELNSEFYSHAFDKYTDPATRLEDIRALGIDVQLLSLTPLQHFYWVDAGLATRVASLQNERIAELVDTSRDRFVDVGTLPMGHPEGALAEAKRVAQLGFLAVEIGALDAAALEPVWDAFESLGLVVILPPFGFTEARRLTDYMVNEIGIPLSTTVALTRLNLSGLFEKHSNQKMLLVHDGGYLPFYWARTDHALLHRSELRKHIDRPPSEYLSVLYFDHAVFDPAMVTELMKRYGPDRVLLGTDYPFDMGLKDPLAFLEHVPIAERENERIAGQNARRLFGLVHVDERRNT